MHLIQLHRSGHAFYINPLRLQEVRPRQSKTGSELDFGEWAGEGPQHATCDENPDDVARQWMMAMEPTVTA